MAIFYWRSWEESKAFSVSAWICTTSGVIFDFHSNKDVGEIVSLRTRDFPVSRQSCHRRLVINVLLTSFTIVLKLHYIHVSKHADIGNHTEIGLWILMFQIVCVNRYISTYHIVMSEHSHIVVDWNKKYFIPVNLLQRTTDAFTIPLICHL